MTQKTAYDIINYRRFFFILSNRWHPIFSRKIYRFYKPFYITLQIFFTRKITESDNHIFYLPYKFNLRTEN